MFEKTLSDLVKGLRSNKRREAEFVSKCIAEIKEELSSKDKSHQVKANAVLKLAYLQMLGYDMQWASFHSANVAHVLITNTLTNHHNPPRVPT